MEQVRMTELLADGNFAAWTHTQPRADGVFVVGKRWGVWWQEGHDGAWQIRGFKDWNKAHKFFGKRVSDSWDCALVDRVRGHKPPVLRRPTGKKHKNGQPIYHRFYWPWPPVVEMEVNGHGVGHYWCPHCRRPTKFSFFNKHHAMPGRKTIGWDLRCVICGVRRCAIEDYYQRWGGKK